MCSQDCVTKMKIICLNTVQVLFKDAFDKFSNNILNSNNDLLNLLNSNETIKSDHQKATTSFSDQNCQNELNDKNISNNSQLVLCNLMQNLTDAINEQCIKQLPTNQIKCEKKKRKRKRKRKKSKPNETNLNEMCNEQEIATKKQMKRTEYFTNDQFKPIDKMLDSSAICSSIPSKLANNKHECNQRAHKHIKSHSKCDLNFQSTNVQKDCQRNEILSARSSSSTSSTLIRSHLNKHHQQYKSDEKSLKRKRDDSPTYKDKRRITSARKRPILYNRKHFSSSSSSCSQDSFSSSTVSSSSDE